MHSNFTAGMKRFCVYIKLLLIVVLTFFKYNTSLALGVGEDYSATTKFHAEHHHQSLHSAHFGQQQVLPPNAESIFEIDVEEEVDDHVDFSSDFYLPSGLIVFHLTCRKQEEQRFKTFSIGTHQPLGLKEPITVRYCVFRI